MDPGKQKEIASKGGRAAHAKGTAHEFDTGEAREAGRKGGMAVSRNREHMAAIGRRGGEARGHGRNRSGNHGNPNGTGNSGDGAEQSTRSAPGTTDREVSFAAQEDGPAVTGQNIRAGTSLGGERRPPSSIAGENDQSTRGEREGFRNR